MLNDAANPSSGGHENHGLDAFHFTTFSKDDAIYSQLGATSLPSLANSIRRSTRTVRNRLRSIYGDSKFVQSVSHAFGLPLVANARAGDWYVNPQLRVGGVYFKSTDGHTNEWGFSKRRLNLGLLEIAGANNGRGAVIVDSTRRGKRFPDSLSKTVPIWIAVLNSALFSLPLELHTTPLAVSLLEHSQIEARLPAFLSDFLSLNLDLPALRRQITKPLRPIFVQQTSTLPGSPPSYPDFTPLVLCTASRLVTSSTIEGEYIQGAGDDHEGWASSSGLTPVLFWAHHELLLATSDAELESVIRSLAPPESTSAEVSKIKPAPMIIAPVAAKLPDSTTVVVNCTSTPLAHGKCIPFPLPAGKAAAKQLRLKLPELLEQLSDCLKETVQIAVVDETGDGVAPAVALAVLCRFYDEAGNFLGADKKQNAVDKAMVKRRMAWISAARGTANPSRQLLNSVNSVLMERY